jgi:hypothetical protein
MADSYEQGCHQLCKRVTWLDADVVRGAVVDGVTGTLDLIEDETGLNYSRILQIALWKTTKWNERGPDMLQSRATLTLELGSSYTGDRSRDVSPRLETSQCRGNE